MTQRVGGFIEKRAHDRAEYPGARGQRRVTLNNSRGHHYLTRHRHDSGRQSYSPTTEFPVTALLKARVFVSHVELHVMSWIQKKDSQRSK